MKAILIALCLFGLIGCRSLQTGIPDAGKAKYSKIVSPDGTTTETLTIDAPEQADGATFATVGEVQIEFARSFKWELPQLPNYTPQNILYGVGAFCIVMGAVFIGIGRRFKLGFIAGGAGIGIILLAVTIEHTGELIAMGGAAIVFAGAAFISWFIWADYKDDGAINGSKLRLSQP